MIQYKHRRVGGEFVEDCLNLLTAGDSLVMLAPRFGGKKFMQNRLLSGLKGIQVTPMVICQHFARSRPRSLDEVTFGLIGPGESTATYHVGNPFVAITHVHAWVRRRVILLAPSVDALPLEVARKFIEHTRAAVQDDKVAAALSSEMDFRDLVSGPGSDFNCAEQFVLQGFERETYEQEFRHEADLLGLRWVDEGDAISQFWNLTNGNLRVAKVLITAVNESNKILNQDAPVCTGFLRDAIKPQGLSSEIWAGVLGHATDVIGADPDCCSDLETLIETEAVPARSLDGAPGALEFSGLGVRNGMNIVFASEFMKELARRRLGGLPIADLFVRAGKWREAFERYARLGDHPHMRPSTLDDRRPAFGALQALCSEMFGAVRGGVDSVIDLLDKGASLVLGFPEVSFWERDHEWRHLPPGNLIPTSVVRKIREALSVDMVYPGAVPLSDEYARFAIAAALPGRTSERTLVVVLSAFESRRVLSREQREFARRLLDAFGAAYTQALQEELGRERLEKRDKHVHILSLIFDHLGKPNIDVRQVLELTGDEMLKLGYKRIMFSLVDPKRERIIGLLDCPSTSPVKLAPITNYLLSNPMSDIQPYTVEAGKTMIVQDARRERLVNQEACAAAALGAFAIIPILSRHDDVVGTMHIEREDGRVLTTQEVTDLELFARQLGRLLTLTERMTLIHSSLDNGAEPLMITNPAAQVIYANRMAAKPFGITPGWQERPRELFRQGSIERRTINEALKNGESVHQIRSLGSNATYRGDLVCAALTNWRQEVIGAFIDVHDLSQVFKVLDQLTRIGSADSFEEAERVMMDAFASFDHPQVRMYVIDPNTGLLTSHLAVGLDSESDRELKESFERGEITLPPRERNPYAWLSLDEREPRIFYWGKPDSVINGRGIKITDFGFEATAIENPTFPKEFPREPGSYWVSFPLFMNKEPFGKVTIMCKGDLRPDVFETMKLLADRTSDLLLARQKGEEIIRVREEAVRDSVETMMAAVSHNLGSRLASLPLILGRYRIEEEDYPPLKELNDDLKTVIDHSMKTILRTRERLARMVIRPQKFDLVEVVTRTLRASLESAHYRLTSPENLAVEADPHLLESALVELIQNSAQFAPEPDNLKVSVSVRRVGPQTAEIVFTDNGPGVLPEHKTRIFEAFFAHRPGRAPSTGLGLAYVRRVMEAHHGTIRENGQVGNGAEFTLEIPLSQNVEVPSAQVSCVGS